MTSLTLVRRIAARPTIVFEALSTVEGLTAWWGPGDFPVLWAQADIQVGGSYRVLFRTADGLRHECGGTFLDIRPPTRLIMSWQWLRGGEPQERGQVSRVEMHLRPFGAGTELTLIHAGLRNEASRRSHEGGWNGALDKLKKRLGVRARATQ